MTPPQHTIQGFPLPQSAHWTNHYSKFGKTSLSATMQGLTFVSFCSEVCSRLWPLQSTSRRRCSLRRAARRRGRGPCGGRSAPSVAAIQAGGAAGQQAMAAAAPLVRPFAEPRPGAARRPTSVPASGGRRRARPAAPPPARSLRPPIAWSWPGRPPPRRSG